MTTGLPNVEVLRQGSLFLTWLMYKEGVKGKRIIEQIKAKRS